MKTGKSQSQNKNRDRGKKKKKKKKESIMKTKRSWFVDSKRKPTGKRADQQILK